MRIIYIPKNSNGSHDNQTIDGVTPETFPMPEGWAVVPDGLETPNFPFGEVEVEEKQYIVEEGEEDKPAVTIPVMAVTSWTPLPIPEPEPEPEPEATQLDRVEAQATYTAMMTDTMLEV